MTNIKRNLIATINNIFTINKEQLSESNRGIMFSKAQKHYLNGRLDDCIYLCKDAQDKYPQDALLDVLIASCYEEKGNSEEAFSFLRKAITKDDNCPNALFALGQYYFKKGKYLDAIQNYKLSLNLLKSENGYIQITNAYLLIERPEDAYYFACMGKKNYPKSAKINYLLALILIEYNNDDLGARHFIDIIQYIDLAAGEINMAEIEFCKAKCYYLSKEYKKSIESFNIYLKTHDEDIEAKWMFINALLLAGYLIDWVGYLLLQWDLEDSLAIEIVNKYKLFDFEERIFNADNMSDEEQQKLLLDILGRIKQIGSFSNLLACKL